MVGRERPMDIPPHDKIDDLTKPELKALFSSLFERAPPPRAGRAFLTSNIAWELQARVHGRLDRRLERRLRTLAQRYKEDPDYTPTRRDRSIKPGTRLIREWNGRQHIVTVSAEGFEYQGERYGSLSEIARKITGTRWSGPAFFGLKSNRKMG